MNTELQKLNDCATRLSNLLLKGSRQDEDLRALMGCVGSLIILRNPKLNQHFCLRKDGELMSEKEREERDEELVVRIRDTLRRIATRDGDIRACVTEGEYRELVDLLVRAMDAHMATMASIVNPEGGSGFMRLAYEVARRMIIDMGDISVPELLLLLDSPMAADRRSALMDMMEIATKHEMTVITEEREIVIRALVRAAAMGANDPSRSVRHAAMQLLSVIWPAWPEYASRIANKVMGRKGEDQTVREAAAAILSRVDSLSNRDTSEAMI